MTAYDTVPYPGSPFEQTHPNRLATLATLFGMRPAPVTRSRVLELGCTDGANLIPMALTLPESEFLGIDLAASPIETGLQTIRELGLKNITLRACDVLQVDASWGRFDYIIAHGLYSWVPEPVREQILRISQQNLAPVGLAYISYNSLPGGHLRRMIREMMLFHLRDKQDPQDRVRGACELLAFLAASSRSDEYRAFIKIELEMILERNLNVLFHDELAEVYEPFFFHQFMADASRHGLQFLSEANFFDMQDGAFEEPVRKGLTAFSGADRIAREQYRDFLKARKFRQTVLCHAECTLAPEPLASAVHTLYAASAAKLISIDDAGVHSFEGQRGSALKTAHPIAAGALKHLVNAWPNLLHFDELLSLLGIDDAEALSEILLATYSAGLVDLQVWRPPFAVSPGERPLASPLARLQAQTGSLLTTLRHATVESEGDLERKLITLLDGTRDRRALAHELEPLWQASPGKSFDQELQHTLRKVGSLALLLQ